MLMQHFKAKQQVRDDFSQKRDAFFRLCDPQKASQKASGHITAYLKKQSGFWGSYRPIKSEFNPQAIEQDHPHLKWVYPKIKGQNLEFHLALKPKAIWEKNQWGIEELADGYSKVIPLDQINGILCPALALNFKGHRIGYGKGYYDCILSHFKGEKIALAFSIQIVSQALPQDKGDIAMHRILTEKGFFRCQPL